MKIMTNSFPSHPYFVVSQLECIVDNSNIIEKLLNLALITTVPFFFLFLLHDFYGFTSKT